jgi:hypothetical protein
MVEPGGRQRGLPRDRDLGQLGRAIRPAELGQDPGGGRGGVPGISVTGQEGFTLLERAPRQTGTECDTAGEQVQLPAARQESPAGVDLLKSGEGTAACTTAPSLHRRAILAGRVGGTPPIAGL